MNKKRLLEKIIDNWIALAVCFVLALIIYFFYQMSTLDRKVFTVPLSIVENGSMTAATNVNRIKTVKVSVRARTEQLASVSENDFVACVDLSAQTKEGKFQFPVLVTPADRLLLMEPLEITVNPESISLNVEESIFRYVPLKPSISGEVLYGYEVSSIKLEPETIYVEGPKSIVESLDSIPTTELPISGLSESIEKEIFPVNRNSLIKMDSQTNVNASVNISEAITTKNFEKIQIAYTNLNGAEIVNGPFYIDVTLKGTVLQMEKLSKENILARVNCANLQKTGLFTLPVTLVIPNKTELVEQSVQTVELSVLFPEPEVLERVEENAGEIGGGDAE